MKLNSLRYGLIGLIVVLLIVAFLLLKSSGIADIELIQDFVLGFGMLAPVIFILIYIVGTLIGISAVIFTILAGTIFGLWWGWLIVVVAATISANVAFVIARYFKSFFEKYQRRSRKKSVITNLVEKIENNAKKNGFTTIVLLRMSFLPYIPLSYASGLVKNLKMRHFTLATMLTNVLGSFFFIFLGFSITQSLPYFIVGIVLVITFSQLPKIIKRAQNSK